MEYPDPSGHHKSPGADHVHPFPRSSTLGALALIAVAQFLVIMDTAIIGVALPEIQCAIGFSQAELSWVFNAYVIAFGGLLLLGGRLSDLYGPRRIFAAGFAILAGASLLTGLATSEVILLAGRALQGVGSALIAPAALTLLMTLFSHDPRELTKALALYGAAAPAGGTAGVFMGGLLTEAVDWRWVFFINVPIALVVLAVIGRILSAGLVRRGNLDILGALSVTAALSLAVFGIVRAPEIGWGSPETLLVLGAAIGLFALFITFQARSREPLMPLSILRAPNLAAANVAMALLGAAWIPMWFFLDLYLQQVLRFGAFEGGAALLPMTVTIMVLMVGVTGRLVGRYGFKAPLVSGMLVLDRWDRLAQPRSTGRHVPRGHPRGDHRGRDRHVAGLRPGHAGGSFGRAAGGGWPRGGHRQHHLPSRIGAGSGGHHGHRHGRRGRPAARCHGADGRLPCRFRGRRRARLGRRDSGLRHAPTTGPQAGGSQWARVRAHH